MADSGKLRRSYIMDETTEGRLEVIAEHFEVSPSRAIQLAINHLYEHLVRLDPSLGLPEDQEERSP